MEPQTKAEPRGKARPARRILGESWQDWDPATTCPAVIDDGPGLFVGASSALSIASAGIWLFLVWVAEPRLLAMGVGALGIRGFQIGGTALLLLPSGLLGGLLLGLKWPARIARALQHWSIAVWRLTESISPRLGISRDRLGHAFGLLANRLALLSRRTGTGSQLLLLAPRCLKPDLMRALRGMAESAGARFVVATGGEEARAAVYGDLPSGVLAVACERDLIEGMRDLLPKLTVLGLPNRRPDGPCRNSEVSVEEARRLLDRLQAIVRSS